MPALSSLSIPDDMVTCLTRHGIYALAMSDKALQVRTCRRSGSRTAAT